MSPVSQRPILRPGSTDRIMAALDVGRKLMADDLPSFKRGYSLDNALLAVTELHELDAGEAACVGRMLARAAA